MISPLIFKIAAQLIDQQLSAPAPQEQAVAPQHEEPADLPRDYTPGSSALRFFGIDSATAKEPAPKVVTVSGGREGGTI